MLDTDIENFVPVYSLYTGIILSFYKIYYERIKKNIRDNKWNQIYLVFMVENKKYLKCQRNVLWILGTFYFIISDS